MRHKICWFVYAGVHNRMSQERTLMSRFISYVYTCRVIIFIADVKGKDKGICLTSKYLCNIHQTLSFPLAFPLCSSQITETTIVFRGFISLMWITVKLQQANDTTYYDHVTNLISILLHRIMWTFFSSTIPISHERIKNAN